MNLPPFSLTVQNKKMLVKSQNIQENVGLNNYTKYFEWNNLKIPIRAEFQTLSSFCRQKMQDSAFYQIFPLKI